MGPRSVGIATGYDYSGSGYGVLGAALHPGITRSFMQDHDQVLRWYLMNLIPAMENRR